MRFFRNNGVKAIRAKLPRDQNGTSLCYAFVLTLNATEKQKALAMSNKFNLENRVVLIDETKPRR